MVIKHVRFSIFPKLTSEMILGAEILNQIKFEMINEKMVTLGGIYFDTFLGSSCLTTLDTQNFNYGSSILTIEKIELSLPENCLSPNVLVISNISGYPSVSDFSINQLSCELKTRQSLIFNTISLDDATSSVNPAPRLSVETGNVVLSLLSLDLKNFTSPVKISKIELGKNSENFIPKNNSQIKILTNNSELSIDSKNKLSNLLSSYDNLFSVSEDDVGLYVGPPVDISLRDKLAVVPKQRNRKIPFAVQPYVDEYLDKYLNNKIFKELTKGAENASPCHVVKTIKNGVPKFRLTVDYSLLNKFLVSNVYPIPRIRTIISDLSGAKLFTSLDLKHGFWNIKISEKSRKILAFSVGDRQFEPLRLPMGLSASPGIFQAIMKKVMRPCSKFTKVYLDDVLIFSKSEEEHLQHLKSVFEAFRLSGIKLNLSKCLIARKHLKYLGFEITGSGWRILPQRVKEIEKISAPRNLKSLKSFLGALNFVSYNLPELQRILGPLHQIGSKNHKFEWNSEHQNIFERVKEVLRDSVMLNYPSSDPSRTMFLTTDASNTGWAGTLSQLDRFSHERPLGFASGHFKGPAMNYSIKDKEFVSFVNSLNYFEEFLYGTRFVWRTDNQCLNYLQSSLKNLSNLKNQRLIRNLTYINEFSFSTELVKGTSPKILFTDYLSRMKQKSNGSINTLDFSKLWTKNNDLDIIDIVESQGNDSCLKNKESFQKSDYWKNLRQRGLKVLVSDNILLGKFDKSETPKILLPKSLEDDVILMNHLPFHLNQKDLMKNLKEQFYFPKMGEKISSVLKNCLFCSQNKPDKQKVLAKNLTSTPRHPWSEISLDLYGPLPLSSKGNKLILVICCLYSRYVILKALPSKHAIGIVKALDECFSEFGLPLNVLTDNGSEFENFELREYLKNLHIHKQKICPYRPTSNSVIERKMAELGKTIKMLRSEGQDWDENLKIVQYSINMRFNRSLGFSSFEIFLGWRPLLPSLIDFKNDNNIIDSTLQLGVKDRILLKRAIMRDIYAQEFNRKQNLEQTDPKDLPVGQQVLMKTATPVGHSSKLFMNWKGVFVIKKKLDSDTYLVHKIEDPRKGFVVFRDRLKIFGPKISDQIESQEGEGKGSVENNSDTPKLESETTKSKPYNLRKRTGSFTKFF